MRSDMDEEASSRLICVTGMSVEASPAECNVANGVRLNSQIADGPSVVYEGERFLSLGVAISDPHCSTR